MKPTIRKTLLALLALILIGAGAAALWLQTSQPQTTGTVDVADLKQPVEIIRDENGIPHIFAQTKRDAHFALGFVHAQDRLWQMEFTRRVGAGRLSEILGRETLGTDKFLRTLG
ncbi:MAG: penicillin acylase family protein, partial [Rickettsiales bacterium]